MYLGIVGSRKFTDEAVFNAVVDEWIATNGTPTYIISGGCSGADALAVRYAKKHKILYIEHRPDWGLGKAAGPIRNTKIVADSTHLIAFPDADRKGTLDTIKKANAKKIPVFIYNV